MGRRSDHSRDELHQLALDAACRIVDSQGIDALTARRVAHAIGYSPGSLYNVFAGLDDIITHLNGRSLDLLAKRLEETRRSRNPNTSVLRLLDAYLGFESDHPNLWSALFEHRRAASSPLPDWYLAKVDHALGLVEEALAPLFEPQSDEQKQLAARTIWASLHGITSLAKAGKLEVVTTETGKAMARHMVENYLAGLVQRKSE